MDDDDRYVRAVVDVGLHRAEQPTHATYWYAVTTDGWGEAVSVAVDADPINVVAELERFIVRAQQSLRELRLQVAANPPASCVPDHAEPEEISLGFGGITYRCSRCGAQWFKRVY